MRKLLRHLPFLLLICAVPGADGALTRPARVVPSRFSGVCLVQWEDQAPEPLPGLRVTVYERGSNRTIAEAVTDAKGGFQIALAPGRYRVVPALLVATPPNLMPPPCPQVTDVEILPGRPTEMRLVDHRFPQSICD
jgi:hypothetical protein